MAKLITGQEVNLDSDEAVLLSGGNFGGMKFGPSSGEPNVYLAVFNVPTRGLYAVATKTQALDKEVRFCYSYFNEDIKGSDFVYINGVPVASGTCDLDANGNATNIKLKLTENYSNLETSKLLHFSNANVNGIEDSTERDIIYINSNGVNSEATLNFSKGEDTIKFNGKTTVQNISGGGQTGVHLL